MASDKDPLTKQDLAGLFTGFKIVTKQMQKDIHELQEYVDTVSSPLYKRIYWWFCGYYFRKVGRWY